jgi:hypothetical protein
MTIQNSTKRWIQKMYVSQMSKEDIIFVIYPKDSSVRLSILLFSIHTSFCLENNTKGSPTDEYKHTNNTFFKYVFIVSLPNICTKIEHMLYMDSPL